MDIGSVIKDLRGKRGMNQKTFAEKCGLSANALCALENNKSFPTKDTIEKICAALSIPVSYLLFCSITDEDVPEERREAFNILRKPLKAVLLPETIK